MPDYAPKIQDTFTRQSVSKMWQKRHGFTDYVYTLFGTTTGSTATEIFVDGISGQRIGIPNESAVAFLALYCGFNITDDEASAQANFGLIENDGGTTALIGTVSSLINTAAADLAAISDGSSTTSIAYTADDTNDALACTVTGTAAKTIYHTCHIILIPGTDPNFLAAYKT